MQRACAGHTLAAPLCCVILINPCACVCSPLLCILAHPTLQPDGPLPAPDAKPTYHDVVATFVQVGGEAERK